MKLPLRRINLWGLVVLGLFIFAIRFLHKQILSKREESTNQNSVSDLSDFNEIAKNCLDDLRNPVARKNFRSAVSKNSGRMLGALIENLPNCAKRAPRKFIADFVEVLLNILDDVENDRIEFESPWGNRTHLSTKVIKNLCPEFSPLMQGKINITFNGETIQYTLHVL